MERSELTRRVITAVVGIVVVFLSLIMKDRTLFYLIVALIGIVAIYEAIELFSARSILPVIVPTFLVNIFLAYKELYGYVLAIIFLGFIVSTAIQIVNSREHGILDFDFGSIRNYAIINLWVVTPLLAGLYLKNTGNIAIIFVTLITVWATDTFAYFGGILFGKRRLHLVSPKKTIEGAIIGTIGAIVLGTLSHLLICARSLPVAITFSLTISVAGQIGDLFESAVKRRAGKKDSGRFFPGHGGVLDRIDSLLFAIPLSLLFLI